MRTLHQPQRGCIYCEEVDGLTVDTLLDQLDWDFIEDTNNPAYDDEHYPDEE